MALALVTYFARDCDAWMCGPHALERERNPTKRVYFNICHIMKKAFLL
jgi:hypothetical protein